mmetsp:Transcript_8994/g.29735  ORF Transcript_8994/g.29735 Transcript_8994/m.29735 type:complete len:425 (+) Transcript_8994:834-2108(+)
MLDTKHPFRHEESRGDVDEHRERHADVGEGGHVGPQDGEHADGELEGAAEAVQVRDVVRAVGDELLVRALDGPALDVVGLEQKVDGPDVGEHAEARPHRRDVVAAVELLAEVLAPSKCIDLADPLEHGGEGLLAEAGGARHHASQCGSKASAKRAVQEQRRVRTLLQRRQRVGGERPRQVSRPCWRRAALLGIGRHGLSHGVGGARPPFLLRGADAELRRPHQLGDGEDGAGEEDTVRRVDEGDHRGPRDEDGEAVAERLREEVAAAAILGRVRREVVAHQSHSRAHLEEDPKVWQQLVVEVEDAHRLERAADAPEPKHGDNEVLDPDARREEQTRRDVDGERENGSGVGPGGVVAPEDGTDAKGHLYEGAEPMQRNDDRRVRVRLGGSPRRGEALALRACDCAALCNVHDAPRVAIEEEEADG